MSDFSKSVDRNPLLRDLPIDIDQSGWWKRLTHNPFKGEDLRACPTTRHEFLLDRFNELYVPTERLSIVAAQMHRMLVGGLIDRDPHRIEQKQALYQLAACVQSPQLLVPAISSSPRGMLLQGVTKQGKTSLVKRVLSQYPQVIRRPADTEAGWLYLDQLVYLVIPMPTDASKTGFLMQAFIELDKVLGTNYASRAIIRKSTIDAQLVQLLATLAMHRCGLLVIEEAQDSNELTQSRFGRDFATFFLRVLNTGIPTILIGNPLAFQELETNSQLMSRLTDPGRYELQPSSSPEAREWTRDLVPGIWGKNLLAEPDEPLDNLDEVLWHWTGGFKHYLSILRRETLRAALHRGSPRVCREDIDSALKTSVMVEGQKITQSYWSGVRQGETDYHDIPGAPSLQLRARQSRAKARGR